MLLYALLLLAGGLTIRDQQGCQSGDNCCIEYDIPEDMDLITYKACPEPDPPIACPLVEEIRVLAMCGGHVGPCTFPREEWSMDALVIEKGVSWNVQMVPKYMWRGQHIKWGTLCYPGPMTHWTQEVPPEQEKVSCSVKWDNLFCEFSVQGAWLFTVHGQYGTAGQMLVVHK